MEGLTTPTEVLEWRHGGPSRPGGACGTGFTGSGFAKPLERELEFLAWPRAKCFTHTDQACPFRTDLVRTAFLAEHVVSPENSSDSSRSSGASGSTDGSLEGTLSVSQILGSLERTRRALKKQSAGSPEESRKTGDLVSKGREETNRGPISRDTHKQGPASADRICYRHWNLDRTKPVRKLVQSPSSSVPANPPFTHRTAHV